MRVRFSACLLFTTRLHPSASPTEPSMCALRSPTPASLSGLAPSQPRGSLCPGCPPAPRAACPSGSTPDTPCPLLLILPKPHAPWAAGVLLLEQIGPLSFFPQHPIFCVPSLCQKKCPHGPVHAAFSSLSVLLLRKTHPHLPGRGHVDPPPASPFIRGTATPFAVLATPDRPLREGRPGVRLWSVSCSAQGRTSPSGHPWLSSWLKLGAVLQASEQGWL